MLTETTRNSPTTAASPGTGCASDARPTTDDIAAPADTSRAQEPGRAAVARRAASRWHASRSEDGDEGSAALELAVAMIAAILGMVVLSVGYQIQTSTDDVAEAAGQAARAASMTASPAQARAVAATTARQRLATGACRPGTVDVSTDVTEFRAGGAVTVTVACTTRLPLGGPHWSRSTAREIIDRYRGGL